MTRIATAFMIFGFLGSTAAFAVPQVVAQNAVPTPAQAPQQPSASPAPAVPEAEPARAPTTPQTTATPTSATAQPVAKSTNQASEVDGAASRLHDRIAFFNARLAGLHAGLMLTADQQKLWPPLEQAIRDVARARFHEWRIAQQGRRMIEDGAEPSSVGTAPFDLLKNTGEQLEQHGRALQALAESAQPFFASLSEEQKHRLPPLLGGLVPRRGPIARMMTMVVPDLADRDQGGRDEHRYGEREDRREDQSMGNDRGGGEDHDDVDHGEGRHNRSMAGDGGESWRHREHRGWDRDQANDEGSDRGDRGWHQGDDGQRDDRESEE